MKKLLFAALMLLSPLSAGAQPFDQFVAGLPSASALAAADSLYVLQGGASKKMSGTTFFGGSYTWTGTFAFTNQTNTPTIAFTGVSGQFPSIQGMGYGATSSFTNIRSNGAPGSDTAVLASAGLGVFSWQGYDGTAFSSNAASIEGNATATNWTNTNHGSLIFFRTTPTGSTTLNTPMMLGQGLALGTLGFNAIDPGQASIQTVSTTPGFFNYISQRAYGASASFTVQRTDGTLGSETAVQSGEGMGGLTWQGYDGSVFSTNAASIVTSAVGNWTTGNHGTQIQFRTTPSSSVTLGTVASLGQGFAVGSVTDPGAGNISATNFSSAGVFEGTGTLPTITGSCAVVAGTQTGGSTVGKFAIPVTPCTASATVILAFPAGVAPPPNGYACDMHNLSTPTSIWDQTGTSGTGVTFTVRSVTSNAADIISFKCMAY